MAWFTFRQKNSYGKWHRDSNVRETVCIEADTFDAAWEIGDRFFDHSEDCPCCGDRWPTWEEDADMVPSYYGEPFDLTKIDADGDVAIHPANGPVYFIKS